MPETIPEPVQKSMVLPPPRSSAPAETYSVVVNHVRVHDLLFALARDARLNVDIHPGISGTVSLNAIDQTLPQLLNRIARQVDMRFELDGPNLAVMPDAPFLRTYQIDYVNMSRDTTGAVAVTTQVASGAPGAASVGIAAPPAFAGTVGANNSITRIENKSQNHFWETVAQNLRDILRETDKILPEGTSETVVEQSAAQSTTGTGVATTPGRARRGAQNAPSIAASPHPATMQNSGTTVVRRSTFREAASVILHPESGVLTVRATSRQHDKIEEFLSRVMQSVKRQVLIEATVAEVQLSSLYQQGIDWSASTLGRAGFTITQKAAGAIASPPSSLLQLSYNNTQSGIGAFTSAIKLLEKFGEVKVLSSPKLSVMNNQTAVMKVVDNTVYFTLKADTTANTNTTTTTFTTTLQSVPVGFVMNVTPQVSENDSVILNIRPSISSVVAYIADPNPTLANPCGFGVADCAIPAISSQIPVVRTREMESILRIDNGNIAVMGGLIEDRVENADHAVPALSRLPLVGELFKHRNDLTRKTELVIFLRPVVIKDASIEGDFRSLHEQLPRRGFFRSAPTARRIPPRAMLESTACDGSSSVCQHTPPNRFEESPNPQRHHQRVEIVTGCNANCSVCAPAAHAPPRSYARLSAWVDCDDCDDITLGLAPSNAQGYATDAWEHPIRYAVTTANRHAFTTANGLRAAWAADPNAIVPDLRVCTSARGIAGDGARASCTTGSDLTHNAVLVLVATGKNGAAAPGGVDEQANAAGHRAFVSHGPVGSGAPTGAFDDTVLWLSPHVLYNRLILAGRLP